MSVEPYIRAGMNGGNTALMKGGPEASSATMALTCFERESASIQPNCPPWECVNKITGCVSVV